MTSKLDPQRKARDHRRNDEERKKRKRHHEKPKTPLHVDATSIVFASQQPDAESRYIFLEVLPDMTEEWIDKIVFLRSPTTGTPDRSFLGIQSLDDSLAWIELSLAAPAPPNEGNEPPPAPDPSGITWIRHYASGVLASNINPNVHFGISIDPGVNGSTTGGHIWVSDAKNNRFFAINPTTGARGTTITATLPTALCHDPVSNDIYIVESRRLNAPSNADRVREFTKSGTLIGTLITAGSVPEPYKGIAVNPAGTHVYVADDANNRVRKVTTAGSVALNLTHTDLADPMGVHVAANGLVYVASADFSKNVVVVFNESGVYQTTIGTVNSGGSAANGNFDFPDGIWTDPYNRVFICDSTNGRVQIFNATTRAYIDKFGTVGTGDGQFRTPSGITGTDLGGGAVRVFIHDGGGSGITPRVSVWDIDATV